RGGERVFRRCHQPRRHRGTVEHRRVLRPELFLRSARAIPRYRFARPIRTGHGGTRFRQDPRGAQRVAVLPRPAAGFVRGAGGAMSRSAPAARPLRKPVQARRPLRTVLKVFGWILFLLILPPLAWFTYNRIDESPSADARRWANQPRREVKDADNGWLYLYGIGAAEGDDPIALGRRRADAYTARARNDPSSRP